MSLEGDSLGDLQHVLVGEGALWVEVVAALALHPPHQVAHVRREAVLGGGPGQAHTPANQSVCRYVAEILVILVFSKASAFTIWTARKYFQASLFEYCVYLKVHLCQNGRTLV